MYSLTLISQSCYEKSDNMYNFDANSKHNMLIIFNITNYVMQTSKDIKFTLWMEEKQILINIIGILSPYLLHLIKTLSENILKFPNLELFIIYVTMKIYTNYKYNMVGFDYSWYLNPTPLTKTQMKLLAEKQGMVPELHFFLLIFKFCISSS